MNPSTVGVAESMGTSYLSPRVAPLLPVPSGIFLMSVNTASRLLTWVNDAPAGSIKSANWVLISPILVKRSLKSAFRILKPAKKLVFYKLYPPFRG